MRVKMKNILVNSKETFKNLTPGNRLTNQDVVALKNFYSEIHTQWAYMHGELEGIDREGLSKAEKNILRILES
jgi:hypothetical protein